MTLVQPDLGDTLGVTPAEDVKEMLSFGEENGKVVVRINSSSLSMLQECYRKSYYSLIAGYRPQFESPALTFGKGIHKALETFYSAPQEERILPDLEDLEMLAFDYMPNEGNAVHRAVSAFVDETKVLSSLPDGDKRSPLNGVWILYQYFKRYIDDPYVAYVDKEGPFIERTFTLRFFEGPDFIIDLFGTIDFALCHTGTGEIIVGDHKTSSALGWGSSNYFDRDKPNHQYTCYSLAAREVYGLPGDEFMVNVVEVKAKPKTARGTPPSFPRQITKRNEDDFEELKEVLVWEVGNLLRAREQNVWPLGSVDVCNKYGGCSFKDVCASPKSMRQTLLSNKFVRSGE